MCSQAQHTLPQPATSSEAATHNYNQLLQAAGWPASSANKHPDTPSSREATACSWQQRILRRKCPHPWKKREQSFSLLAPRGQCLSGLLSPLSEWFLLLIGSCLLCHLQLPSPGWPIVCAGAPSSRMACPRPNSGGASA